jgi:hypothetical protein
MNSLTPMSIAGWPASFWKWGMEPPAIVVSLTQSLLHLDHNSSLCKIDEMKLSQKAGRG